MDNKIFDTLLEPTFIIDKDKKIIYCNEAASTICDVSVRKIHRSTPCLDQIFQFAEKISGLDSLEQITDPTPYQEANFATESGKNGKIQITIQLYSHTEPQKLWLVYFRDVTLEETLQKKYRAELGQKEDVILDLKKAQSELKNYSENLEKMVEERTAEIARMNQTMRALLDSLAQGFFIFDKEGKCLPVYSKSCINTVQTEPAGKQIWEVLKIEPTKVDGFKKWLTALYAEMLPFQDIVAIGPQSFSHSEGLTIQLEYYPLRNSDEVLEGVVVVATDISKLVQAQKDADNEKAHAKMILSLIKHKRAFSSFLKESTELMEQLKTEFNKADVDPENAFRLLHTLKGGSASFSIKNVADQCHEAETMLTTWKAFSTASNLVNLKQQALAIPKLFQEYLEQNSELIGIFNKSERMLEKSLSQILDFEESSIADENLKQKYYEEFIMEPIHNYFQSFNDPVQQVANSEHKLITPLVFDNGDLKIIPEYYENLFSTFIHAYRNAADHGIETPEKRMEKGKSESGTILTQFQIAKENGQEFLHIKIKDDGGGINPTKIRENLNKKGFDHSAETDEQIIQHVFDSQFSTKEQVTETSGRGVGMDAILHSAKRLGGNAWVESTLDKGTTLSIKVPYYRALERSLLKKAA